MLYEFKRDLGRYLAGLGEISSIRSLRERIRYNEAHPRKMLRYGQTLLLAAQVTNGLRILGRAWSERTLLHLAHAFEQATGHRHPPGSIA
jgi:hypothetical protein